ncbi:D-sedoheptulose 7-phosphate isomerase [Cytophaga hutchinsonii]|jgi:D-sedoheptulose 7-phosphate isomerase|uniref:Phosphoheptose isomerase n=1 Tax=Cytophaga hutchinsonii (strain ATCC 33406 / DSM 1761 / CIP 103989 / NBRC 15051 / NCIMB 9469 / D465) TaxID=269798 RepID=GMHA_CYTH3|nr:D-sedoheptulose 7-phosphate isomerase [Cytophaga hutchinsonii]Q11Y71.1 RecName: Full=Phosphoheptose isomerase; AltName: Full=Sedoheptulose 7-phosphate isomerase [Cytophaga hutchinsonii ATCC 33406]ABG57645.1 phosphoheptose isomerase [Cytophaga hutchinsonii ATCC 33406]SFX01895.1 phosphoheptose isomerase [Cytophaga hutchinsonii ATCC 33406]
MIESTIISQLEEASAVLSNFIEQEKKQNSIAKAADVITSSLKQGGKIISCGNGGSSCDAMHFAEELTGRYRENRKAIPAISISDPSHMSCVANDYGYKFVFSRYLEALGNKGDVLLAISTSGNSENVLEAVKEAKNKGMFVVALTGKDGGKLLPLADVCINVPHVGYADRIQEVHIKIIHTLILLIEQSLL